MVFKKLRGHRASPHLRAPHATAWLLALGSTAPPPPQLGTCSCTPLQQLPLTAAATAYIDIPFRVDVHIPDCCCIQVASVRHVQMGNTPALVGVAPFLRSIPGNRGGSECHHRRQDATIVRMASSHSERFEEWRDFVRCRRPWMEDSTSRLMQLRFVALRVGVRPLPERRPIIS